MVAETMTKFGKFGIFCCNFFRLFLKKFFSFFYRAKHTTLVVHNSSWIHYLPSLDRDLHFLRIISGIRTSDVFERRRGLATRITTVATPISRCDAQPRSAAAGRTTLTEPRYTYHTDQRENRSSILRLLLHLCCLLFLLLSFLSFFRFSFDPFTVLLQHSQLSFQRFQFFHQFLQFLCFSLLLFQLFRQFYGFMVKF